MTQELISIQDFGVKYICLSVTQLLFALVTSCGPLYLQYNPLSPSLPDPSPPPLKMKELY